MTRELTGSFNDFSRNNANRPESRRRDIDGLTLLALG
jgi:hypothetical protein